MHGARGCCRVPHTAHRRYQVTAAHRTPGTCDLNLSRAIAPVTATLHGSVKSPMLKAVKDLMIRFCARIGSTCFPYRPAWPAAGLHDAQADRAGPPSCGVCCALWNGVAPRSMPVSAPASGPLPVMRFGARPRDLTEHCCFKERGSGIGIAAGTSTNRVRVPTGTCCHSR